ncbi:hypothetical protein [Reinekea sp.]|jgi:hypothetical protein|uniref:hypothetical protein n=1 Tax=Reinekea sp. TaxID=1970455 RepID=UPI003988D79D
MTQLYNPKLFSQITDDIHTSLKLGNEALVCQKALIDWIDRPSEMNCLLKDLVKYLLDQFYPTEKFGIQDFINKPDLLMPTLLTGFYLVENTETDLSKVTQLPIDLVTMYGALLYLYLSQANALQTNQGDYTDYKTAMMFLCTVIWYENNEITTLYSKSLRSKRVAAANQKNAASNEFKEEFIRWYLENEDKGVFTSRNQAAGKFMKLKSIEHPRLPVSTPATLLNALRKYLQNKN